MGLHITSLRVDYRNTPSGKFCSEQIPYAIFNCTFRIDRDCEDGEMLWQLAKGESEEYLQVLTIESPETYEKFLSEWDFSFEQGYDYGRAWVHNEGAWCYLEKFDTFWQREWIADSPVTRSIISELQYFRKHGKLPSNYRHLHESVVMRHMRVLHEYWD